MIWRQTSSTASAGDAPETISIIGTTVPANAHTEAVSGGEYIRATYHELYREFAHPAPGAPRYCAIYEADVPPRAPTLGGSPEYEVAWRLAYRRIALPD
jgi:hypothetical protein